MRFAGPFPFPTSLDPLFHLSQNSCWILLSLSAVSAQCGALSWKAIQVVWFCNSCGPDCFSLFQTLLWTPFWSSTIRLGEMLSRFCCSSQISWFTFSGIPVHYFALSFSDTSDTPWPVFPIQTLIPWRAYSYYYLYCYLLLSGDLWGYFVNWFCCKSFFVIHLVDYCFYVEIQGDSFQKYFNI